MVQFTDLKNRMNRVFWWFPLPSLTHLSVLLLVQEVHGDVRGQDVLQQLVGVPAHLVHLLELLAGLSSERGGKGNGGT